MVILLPRSGQSHTFWRTHEIRNSAEFFRRTFWKSFFQKADHFNSSLWSSLPRIPGKGGAAGASSEGGAAGNAKHAFSQRKNASPLPYWLNASCKQARAMVALAELLPRQSKPEPAAEPAPNNAFGRRPAKNFPDLDSTDGPDGPDSRRSSKAWPYVYSHSNLERICFSLLLLKNMIFRNHFLKNSATSIAKSQEIWESTRLYEILIFWFFP